MSMKYLGKTFDIHAGGMDLIFPHHENEIAQSEGATGQTFAKYWMHNGYINVDNKKMSKSEGNFFMVRDIAKEYDLEAVRLFMLSAHYRNPVNFSRELIEQAKSSLDRLKNAKDRIEDTAENGSEGEVTTEFAELLEKHRQSFIEAMDDDLNTADALSVLFELIRETNIRFATGGAKKEAQAALVLLNELTGVLGILNKKDSIPKEILDKADERQTARMVKDWKRADALRDEIAAAGYVVEDTPTGPKVKKA